MYVADDHTAGPFEGFRYNIDMLRANHMDDVDTLRMWVIGGLLT